jgi:transcriptional regulator with XRE-family HTH domain
MSLKEIRERKGLTQKQLALKMAMEQTTLSKKERGTSPITSE